jgi:processive 1,2-diacylglycerol beta-glucosyltransferase
VGFRPDQIVKTGFPSQEKFYKKIEKSKARKMLGINAHKFTALLISGGNGLGNTFKLMQNILKSDFHDNIQLLIVCGKNEQMKQKIDHYIAENEIYNVFNYGFVDNVNELMSASDCVFTRSGGGTLSEALNIGVVPILRERTQANETINKKLFIQNNLAFGMKHITDAKKILNSIKHEPSLLSEKQKNIKKFNIPNGLINATNYIIDNLKTKKISDTN